MIGLLLLLALIAALVNFLIKRNRLYKSIVKQNSQAISREKELNERISKLQASVTEPVRIDREKAQDIYDRLCHLMEVDRIYTDGQLNQERLTQLLETNHTYLSQIIKEKSGMNLSQFINSYRIKEAVRVLSDNTQADYPLKQLCSDLGFNSLSRFYVLFKESVGISPSAYRKSAQSLD